LLRLPRSLHLPGNRVGSRPFEPSLPLQTNKEIRRILWCAETRNHSPETHTRFKVDFGNLRSPRGAWKAPLRHGHLCITGNVTPRLLV
jgi:hypothetical protein